MSAVATGAKLIAAALKRKAAAAVSAATPTCKFDLSKSRQGQLLQRVYVISGRLCLICRWAAVHEKDLDAAAAAAAVAAVVAAVFIIMP